MTAGRARRRCDAHRASDGPRGPVLGGVALVAVLALALPIAAQTPPSARGTRVPLVLRPWPGDMLRVLVEHETEERGTMRTADGDSTITTRTLTTVRVHTVVEGADAGGATLRSTLDSVHVQALGGRLEGREQRRRDALALRGRVVRLRVGGDGAVTLLDRSAPAVAVAALAPILERVPAVFPEAPVGVGDRWTRRVAVPGAAGDAIVAEFRLDSLTHAGDRAWVSVRGEMDETGPDRAAGTVQGWLLLDRRRGWITASRLALTMTASTRSPDGGRPVRFELTMEQRMRELR